jgi:hypothetical protein
MPHSNLTNHPQKDSNRKRDRDKNYNRNNRKNDRTHIHTRKNDAPRTRSMFAALLVSIITIASTNVGYSTGLGHRMGTDKGTPLSHIITEMMTTDPTIQAIQEHKLGTHDYSHLPCMPKGFKWDWLGFPGHNRNSQGLGFFIVKGSTILFTKHDRQFDCEVATIVLSHKGLRMTVINTYWHMEGVKNLECLALCMETVQMHYEASLEFQSSATFLVGDLNVNTFNSNQATEKCRLFIETNMGMIRQDTVLDNADEPTRPGGGTHLDCIAFSTVVEARVTNYWNHSWADKIDDHNTLGMSLEVKSHPTDEEPPRIDPRSSPLRYKYEDFTPEEIAVYCNTLEDLIRAGIGDRVRRHLVLAKQPNSTQEHENKRN